MLKRFAVVALTLFPLTASAQSLSPIRGPGALAVTGGIGVNAGGAASYAVTAVRFVAQARGNADDAAVLAALRAAGVDDPHVTPIGGMLSRSGVTAVSGTVRNVTTAKLERVAAAAADFIRAHPGTTLDSVNVSATPDGCSSHEQEARGNALAEARRKADAIATLMNVTIVGVTAVTENGGCPSSTAAAAAYPGPQVDTSSLTATIFVNENVTFAIEPGVGTRRRPL